MDELAHDSLRINSLFGKSINVSSPFMLLRTIISYLIESFLIKNTTCSGTECAPCSKMTKWSRLFKFVDAVLHIYSFYHTEEKRFRKTLWKKVKLFKTSNFTFFRNGLYAICILKSFNSHIVIVVVCCFFEFGTASKWNIRELVNADDESLSLSLSNVCGNYCPFCNKTLHDIWMILR